MGQAQSATVVSPSRLQGDRGLLNRLHTVCLAASRQACKPAIYRPPTIPNDIRFLTTDPTPLNSLIVATDSMPGIVFQLKAGKPFVGLPPRTRQSAIKSRGAICQSPHEDKTERN